MSRSVSVQRFRRHLALKKTLWWVHLTVTIREKCKSLMQVKHLLRFQLFLQFRFQLYSSIPSSHVLDIMVFSHNLILVPTKVNTGLILTVLIHSWTTLQFNGSPCFSCHSAERHHSNANVLDICWCSWEVLPLTDVLSFYFNRVLSSPCLSETGFQQRLNLFLTCSETVLKN